MRSQLLCLNAYVGEDVAARATPAELTGWLDETADLVALPRSRPDTGYPLRPPAGQLSGDAGTRPNGRRPGQVAGQPSGPR
jgi:hypothetical protein